ncbi:hypothetical protein ACJX0J_025067 [Zea mays]
MPLDMIVFFMNCDFSTFGIIAFAYEYIFVIIYNKEATIKIVFYFRNLFPLIHSLDRLKGQDHLLVLGGNMLIDEKLLWMYKKEKAMDIGVPAKLSLIMCLLWLKMNICDAMNSLALKMS